MVKKALLLVHLGQVLLELQVVLGHLLLLLDDPLLEALVVDHGLVLLGGRDVVPHLFLVVVHLLAEVVDHALAVDLTQVRGVHLGTQLLGVSLERGGAGALRIQLLAERLDGLLALLGRVGLPLQPGGQLVLALVRSRHALVQSHELAGVVLEPLVLGEVVDDQEELVAHRQQRLGDVDPLVVRHLDAVRA